MGKAGRWLKSFLSGKKDRPQQHQQPEAMPVLAVLPPPTPKEKRWSFRRPVPAGKSAADAPAARRGVSDEGLLLGVPASADDEFEQKKRAVAVAVATAAAADPAVAAANATAAAARLSSRRADYLPLPATRLVEDAAAVRIQATFRGYLARTALCALRGIVKLQALVRGQLVRKQATATLRCMQALLAAQSQLRAQRMMRVLQEQHHQTPPPQPPRPRQSSPQHPRHQRRSYEMDRSCEEDNAKIVEVDVGSEPARRGAAAKAFVDQYHHHGRCSPAPSQAMTELSPRAYSGHFDEFSLGTAQSSPYHAASTELLCPSYMANTESSRAKQARSQSAPRQRSTDALERLPSRRKGTMPPRSSSASSRMQRSSSLVGGVGAAPQRGGWGGQSPSAWSAARLDVSNASLKDSECGSTTSSVLTAATVYSRTRSLVGFEVRRGMY